MRKLLRNMAKAKMARMGYSKVNRRMSHGRWREVLKLKPRDAKTGKTLGYNFYGKKRQCKGSKQRILMY